MYDASHSKPTSHSVTTGALRFVARSWRDPGSALVYWLGEAEPTHESSFFDTICKFGSLMQLVLPDERPGVFVNRGAVQTVRDCGATKRLLFKDGSSLVVLYSGASDDLRDVQ